jgi:ParB/RepB/Spo0J family partition protein
MRDKSRVKLDELAASIQQQGLLNPIIITPISIGDTPISKESKDLKYFGIVVGERRFLAMKDILKYPQLTFGEHFRVREYETIEEMFFDMLSENLHRENVTVTAIRKIVQHLVEKVPPDEVCKRLGKSRSWLKQINVITKKVTPELQEQVVTGKKGSTPEGKVPTSTAYNIGRQFPINAPEADIRQQHQQMQMKLFDKITQEKLTPEESRCLIQRMKEHPESSIEEAVKDARANTRATRAMKIDMHDKIQLDGEYYIMSYSSGIIALFNTIDKQISTVQLFTERFYCQEHKSINCRCVLSLRKFQQKPNSKAILDLDTLLIQAPVEPPQFVPKLELSPTQRSEVPPVQNADQESPEEKDQWESIIPEEESIEEPNPTSEEPSEEESIEEGSSEPEDTEANGVEEAQPPEVPESPDPSPNPDQEVAQENPSSITPIDSSSTPEGSIPPIQVDIEPDEQSPIPEPSSTEPEPKKKIRQTELQEFLVTIRLEDPYTEKIEKYQNSRSLGTRDEAVTAIVKEYFDMRDVLTPAEKLKE